MSAAGDAAVGGHDLLVWQAKPTARAVVKELLTALVRLAAAVVLLVVLPGASLRTFWPLIIAFLMSSAWTLIVAVRGRVVLTEDGIVVRRVLTRHYPWTSLRSLTVEPDGRIEITPNGWVRKLPIPRAEVPEAFAIITRWRAAAQARS